MIRGLNYSEKDLEKKDFRMLYPEDGEDNVLSNPDGVMVDKSSTCETPL
ncbi:hypothetical protein [Methanomethylovorans sp.]